MKPLSERALIQVAPSVPIRLTTGFVCHAETASDGVGIEVWQKFHVGILAAVGSHLWDDFSRILELHSVEDRSEPNQSHVAVYESLLPVFQRAAEDQRERGEMMANSGGRLPKELS